MTVLLTLSAAGAGCAARRAPGTALPTYPNADHATALRVLNERARSVRTVSAACDLTLARADGQTVRLDGAMAMAPPERLRLRAWKFGQAVFDLTLTPDGLWVVTSDDPARRQKVLPASLSAARLGREWAMLGGSFFGQEGLTVRDDGGRLTVSKVLEDGRTIICDVNRPTLTPRRYRLLDPSGRTRFTLAFSEYHLFDSVPWPTRLLATSDDGRIAVRLKDVELNGELAPNAFKPPRRAEKLP